MIAEQPIDRVPNLRDASLRGAWCNKLVKGGRDYGPGSYDMAYVGTPVDERVGMTFNGASEYLRRAVANWRSTDTLGTMSLWVKRTAGGAGAETLFASVDEAANADRFVLSIASNNFWITSNSGTGSNNQVYVDTTINAGQWYHLVLVSTGAAFLLYIDGVSQPVSVNAGTNCGQWLNAIPNRDCIEIGSDTSNAGVAAYLNASIKDIRYYSRALTADEIKYMYRQSIPDDSLILNIQDGLRDLSRYGRPITHVNKLTVGHSIELDGINQCITVPHATELDIGAGQNMTLLAWVYPTDLGGSNGLITKYDGVIANDTGWFWYGNGDIMTFTFNDGNAIARSNAGQTLVLNMWQLVGVSVDRSIPQVTLYRNSETPSVSGTGGLTGSWAKAVPVTIGALLPDGTGPIAGQMRHVRMFRRAISDDEFTALYEAERIFY